MAPPLPLEIVLLLEDRNQRELFVHEAATLEMRLYATDDPGEVLSYVIHRQPDAVVLPIGRREEESVLLCRSIRKRSPREVLPILFVAYGGSLVESAQEARDLGADRLLSEHPPKALLERVRELVELPMEMDINDSEIIDLSWTADGIAIDESQLEDPATSDPEARAFAPGAGAMVLSTLDDPRGNLRRRLELLYNKLREVREEDYFTLLEVQADASSGEIFEAYLTLSQRFDVELWPVDAYRNLAVELDEIRESLQDAWNVLGNSYLRARYRAALL